MEAKDFYTIKELAARIGYDPGTVYEWAATKGMPVRRAGRRGRISVRWAEFDAWWKENG